MFTVLAIIWLLIGAIPLVLTLRRADQLEETERKKRIARDAAILSGFFVFLIGFNVFFHIGTEYQWFATLGFGERFWIEINAKLVLFAVAFAVAFAFVYANLRFAIRGGSKLTRNAVSLPAAAALATILGVWSISWWDRVLLYLNQAESQIADPVFGRTVGYYLFSLPLYTGVLSWLGFLIIVTAIGVVAVGVVRTAQDGERIQSIQDLQSHFMRYSHTRKQLFALAGLLLLAQAWRSRLNIFELIYSDAGAVTGAGWLAVNVQQPAYYFSVALFVLSAGLLFASIFSERLTQRLFFLKHNKDKAGYLPTRKSWLPIAVVVVLLFTANRLIPSLFTTLYVNPNEITLEEPYIAHNIRFTQTAYGVDDSRVERTSIAVDPRIGVETIEANRETLANVRLWDWRALQDNLSQRQEIRLYYRFNDVDIDRYTIDGEYRQMMLSVRELEKSQLPEQAQNWVSQQLKYTHGYGLVMLPASEFLADGQPNLLLRNIPVEFSESLEESGFTLTQPEIYYGEMTDDHVYVRTTEQEFHYPGEDENIFVTYEGEGGVPLDNFLKRFMFAWKYDGARQLFSSYFTPESRVMFHRGIRSRVAHLAPFLIQDRDPYPVVTDDGRIKFIMDTYMLSPNYPYSEAYTGELSQFHGANYVRNSVKAVIDAYDGKVDFYVTDPDDIIIRTYQNVFPGLFKSFDQMPASVRDHIRYPEDYLTVQADIYRTYHMDNVRTFYQREDVWQFATERYREGFQDVTPYYVMIRFPNGELEFVLMLPFTPKDRNVMNAWMAGHSDPPNYGKLTVYTFPRGVEVLGPRQIEARVDQNSEMSEQLSLWDQHGSSIIRGNLLTVPLFHGEQLSVLFVEPVFLEATGAELPEIRRVILADQDNVYWATNFEQALALLLGRPAEQATGETPSGVAAAPLAPALQSLVDDAVGAFQQYRQQLAEGSFADAGEHLDRLGELMAEIEQSAVGQ